MQTFIHFNDHGMLDVPSVLNDGAEVKTDKEVRYCDIQCYKWQFVLFET